MVNPFRNTSIVSWITMVFRALVVLLFTPWIMSIEQTSNWVTYLAIYNFAILADLTFTPTFSRFYAYCSGQGEKFNDIDYGGLDYIQKRFFLIVSIFGLGLSLVSIVYVIGVVSYSSLILCSSVFITLYTGRYVSVLEGCGSILYVRQVILCQVIVQCLGLLISVAFGFDFFLFVLFYYMPASVSFFLLRSASKQYISVSTRFNMGVVTKYRKVLISQSLKGAISLMSTIGTIQALTLFSSAHYESLGSNVIYSLMLIRQISNFCQVPFYVKIPMMATLYSSGEDRLLLKKAFKLAIITTGLLLSLGMIVPIISEMIDLLFSIRLPALFGSFWILLVIAFVFERTLALVAHYFALRNIILWHQSGPLFMLIVLSSFYVLNISDVGVNSLPISLFLGGLCSLFYLVFKGNRANKLEIKYD